MKQEKLGYASSIRFRTHAHSGNNDLSQHRQWTYWTHPLDLFQHLPTSCTNNKPLKAGHLCSWLAWLMKQRLSLFQCLDSCFSAYWGRGDKEILYLLHSVRKEETEMTTCRATSSVVSHFWARSLHLLKIEEQPWQTFLCDPAWQQPRILSLVFSLYCLINMFLHFLKMMKKRKEKRFIGQETLNLGDFYPFFCRW